METYSEKLPPQNLEAEQSVLGAVLLDNDSLLKALEIVGVDDFYRESHRRIFSVMLELFDRNEAIDLVTVAEHLTRKGQMEDIGGASYLAQLVSQIPTSANIRYHAKIIKEKATLRALISSATEIAGKVYEESLDADELLDFAEKTVFNISDRRIKASFFPLKEIIKDSVNMIERLYDKKESITGVSSGFTELDELTTGFQKSDLIVIGGRPSMGKTALALNIAQHVGIELREPVAIFSLEMSMRQLALRMLCSEAMVDSNLVRKGIIRGQDWAKLTSAAGKLMESPIFIDDSSAINALEMRAKARRLKKEHGLGLVIVDYLQLMRGRGSFERREQEISEISRSLKALAKELDIPVLALSQLNREVEKTVDKRPSLANLRESGAIEQDADVILFLHREEMYDKDNPAKRGKAEVIVAKQRNGPTGSVKLTFLNKSTRFANHVEGYAYEEEVIDTEPF
ncbi:MAG: replicative DNA helicase [Thermodesulfovibrionales bacterium]|nr:replicative DNA helicase [Thermodesulfovibrionales bacterium]